MSKLKNNNIRKSYEDIDPDFWMDPTAFARNFKKSYDFRTSQVAISSVDQATAESSSDKDLVTYIRENCTNDINKIEFSNGILTLAKKEAGIYNGFFTSSEGDVLDKYDDQTIEMVAKNMQIKDIYANSPKEEAEEREEVAPASDSNRPVHVRLRFGDFEFELKKSVNAFIKNYKDQEKLRPVKHSIIRKSLQSWFKVMNSRQAVRSELESAKLLLKNWNDHKEDFMQTVHAITQMEFFK